MATKSVRVGELEKITFRNQTIRGLDLIFNLTAAVANTDIYLNDLLPENIRLKVTLQGRGKDEILYNDSILEGALVSEYLKGTFNMWNTTARTTNVKGKVLTAKGAAVKEVQMLPLQWEFLEPINLTGDDELIVEIDYKATAITADLQADGSSISVDSIGGGGYEGGRIRTKIYQVRAAETQFDEELGDNVVAIYFINLDKTGITTANQVIDTVKFESEHFNYNKDAKQLAARRYAHFEVDDIAEEREGVFNLFHEDLDGGSDADGCKLNIGLVGANVNANKNRVVVLYRDTDPATLQLHDVRKTKHGVKKSERLGLRTGVSMSSLSDATSRLKSVRKSR